jgi:hypothetical protein
MGQLFAPASQAAKAKLGFSVRLEGEGFFLNPVVKKLFVEEVTQTEMNCAVGAGLNSARSRFARDLRTA